MTGREPGNWQINVRPWPGEHAVVVIRREQAEYIVRDNDYWRGQLADVAMLAQLLARVHPALLDYARRHCPAGAIVTASTDIAEGCGASVHGYDLAPHAVDGASLALTVPMAVAREWTGLVQQLIRRLTIDTTLVRDGWLCASCKQPNRPRHRCKAATSDNA